MYSIFLAPGHNNDKAMLILSGWKEYLIQSGEKLLGDRGYASATCVIPDEQFSISWNHKQKALRSVVETVIGLVHNWAAAHQVFRQAPELQELALMICYYLTQHYLLEFPLRLW